MSRFNWIRGVVLAVGCMSLAGCHMGPHFGPQGTIGMQRNWAVLHDPFPSNELGPAITSGRPLGFEQPWSEARQNQDTPYARRGARVIQPSGF